MDDHPLMIAALRLALDREEDIEIVGEARTGNDVLPEVVRTQPELVLLDVRMPGIDGLTILDRLQERHPDVKVVMLSAIVDPEVAKDALRRGAVAYLNKRIDVTTLAASLRLIASGTVQAHDLGAAESPLAPPPRESALTPREREILSRVAAGRSNAEIARELWLSEQTVKYHLTNVYRKLGVKGRTGAIRFAFERGLVDPDRVDSVS